MVVEAAEEEGPQVEVDEVVSPEEASVQVEAGAVEEVVEAEREEDLKSLSNLIDMQVFFSASSY